MEKLFNFICTQLQLDTVTVLGDESWSVLLVDLFFALLKNEKSGNKFNLRVSLLIINYVAFSQPGVCHLLYRGGERTFYIRRERKSCFTDKGPNEKYSLF